MQDEVRQHTLSFASKSASGIQTGRLDNIWQEFLKIVNEEEGSRIVETWFKAVTFVRWDAHGAIAHLKAPNKFVKDWISQNYQKIVCSHLGRLLNACDISILFDDEPGHVSKPAKKAEVVAVTNSQAVAASSSAQSTRSLMIRPRTELVPAKVVKNRGFLNQNYVFDTFVVGSNNSFACSAAQAVAQKPGSFCNPFFIYGASGLGKTHLLHAIGNYIKEHNTRARVLYQPASRFVNEFINAIKFNKVADFEAKFKELDVLLIDDIQSLSGKEQTQEAFFHIFNLLYDNQKQIVFSCDTYPKDINGVEERLRSRFEWGLVADIQAPMLETKIAILRKKAEAANYKISAEVAEFIAQQASNVRVLEGAFIRVIAFSSLTGQDVTLELARRVLVREQPEEKTLTLEHVGREICKFYQLSLSELRSSSRSKDLVQARQVAMYLMKELCDHSLNEIGVYLRRKNHSTVLHAIEKIENQKTKT